MRGGPDLAIWDVKDRPLIPARAGWTLRELRVLWVFALSLVVGQTCQALEDGPTLGGGLVGAGEALSTVCAVLGGPEASPLGDGDYGVFPAGGWWPAGSEVSGAVVAAEFAVEDVLDEWEVVGDAAASVQCVGEAGENVAEGGCVAGGAPGVVVKAGGVGIDAVVRVDQFVEDDVVRAADGDLEGPGIV